MRNVAMKSYPTLRRWLAAGFTVSVFAIILAGMAWSTHSAKGTATASGAGEQAVHDKLAAGRVNDWPEEGICSTPTIEGNRLYYVSNRCELICADTEGFLDGKNDGVQDEKYKDGTDVDVIWRLDMIKELNVF